MKELIEAIREEMLNTGISSRDGLGTELFHFVSTLTPIINVDLLVYNSKEQFILSMRDDPHCGKGWHVPGGCVRFKETVDSRIRKVANTELGLTDFTYDKEPIKVFEIILNDDERNIDNKDERAHFITLVYKCYAPDTFLIDNEDKNEDEDGYLKWFDKLPDDLLNIQSCYKTII